MRKYHKRRQLHDYMSLALQAGSIDGETEWIHFHFWYIWLLLSKHKLVSCFEQCFYIVKVRYFRIENGSILFCHQSTPQATLVRTRDGRPPKNQTSRDNYWHFLRKNCNRLHMSTLFPHFSNGRQLEILRTAFTNIVIQYLCFNILGHKILSSPSLLLSPFVKPKA